MQTPCILLCQIHDESGYCFGCGRTRAEIGGWAMFSDAERDAIMAVLAGRLATLPRRQRRVTRRSASRQPAPRIVSLPVRGD